MGLSNHLRMNCGGKLRANRRLINLQAVHLACHQVFGLLLQKDMHLRTFFLILRFQILAASHLTVSLALQMMTFPKLTHQIFHLTHLCLS